MTSVAGFVTVVYRPAYSFVGDRNDLPLFQDAGVVTSRRYDNMERATDVIVVTRGGIELVMPGVDGRDLSFYPEVRYEANMQNAERRDASRASG